MQLRRAVGFYGLFGVLLIAGVVLGVLVWYHPQSLGMAAGSVRQTLWFSVISATTFVLLAFLGGLISWGARWGARCIVAARDGVSATWVSTDTPSRASSLLQGYIGPFIG